MLKLTLDAIEIIDRGGSFAAAAESLHKVPSTISYTVAKLEEQLGFQLFVRRGPRATLTPAGRELLSEGRWLLRSAADLESRLRRIEFVFCVAPQHPLARIARPLTADDFLAYTAIVVADSARLLPTRSIGLLAGQSRITVSNIEAKIALQIAGLGYGFLPRCRIDAALTRRELVAREVAEMRASEPLWLAWSREGEGEAQKWWRARLQAPGALAPPLVAP